MYKSITRYVVMLFLFLQLPAYGESASEFSQLCWKKKGEAVSSAMVGDTVILCADAMNINDGKTVTITIFKREPGITDTRVRQIRTKVRNGKIESEWTCKYSDQIFGMEYSKKDVASRPPVKVRKEIICIKPEYYFFIKTQRLGGKSTNSPILELKDWIEVFVRDETGKPLHNEEYSLKFPDGTQRKGKLDKHGYLLEENVPIGDFILELNDYGPVEVNYKGDRRRGKKTAR